MQVLDIHYHAGPDLYCRRHNAVTAGKVYQALRSASETTSGMVQKVLFLVSTSHFKKMTITIPIKGLRMFLKTKVLTTFEPCRNFYSICIVVEWGFVA